MDLHNNRIGRDLFEKNASSSLPVIEILKKMMKDAVQVSSSEEMELLQNRLVFIEISETQL